MESRVLVVVLSAALLVPHSALAQERPTPTVAQERPVTPPVAPYRSALGSTVRWEPTPTSILVFGAGTASVARRAGPATDRPCGDVSSDIPALALGGVLGGAVGAAAGVALGLTVAYATQCAGWGCLLIPVWGGIAGYTVAVPVGVHAANGGAGRLAGSLLASAAVLGAGIAVSTVSHSSDFDQALVIAVPAGQLATSVWAELATSP